MGERVRVGVVGASGYTGAELLRLLLAHPRVDITSVSAQSSAGQPLATALPAYFGLCDLTLETVDTAAIAPRADFVFLCLPHGASHDVAREFLGRGVRVIDLSADFRFRDPKNYERWYGVPHKAPELCAEAVYGLPERNRREIAPARLVAAPGCYPTAVQLGLVPIVDGGLVVPSIIADCKSGVSGAGRTAKREILFSEVAGGLRAYSVVGHRHTGEMLDQLSRAAGRDVRLTFVPHLVPMSRGILATIYAPLAGAATDEAVRAAFETAYTGEPFVHLLPVGAEPDTLHVRGTNRAHIAVSADPHGGRVIVRVAIDNLGKGAAGQAVQCFNIMNGIDETTALGGAAIFP
ncbi:MAG: N-acetyl-gamma-glutamyl-phosphate reductase [Deltaproteobacteria bacterium]|nr:N-acetyl-gamma-glutamyl-phosphate reductase [Deltaproteobacteria bacterium]